LIIRKGV